MPAHNKRFCAMADVTPQEVQYRLAMTRINICVPPPLRQAAARCRQCREVGSRQFRDNADNVRKM